MTDEQYMSRAMQLAQQGLQFVSPNPMVGCVIVHQGKIIGEGYHERFGEAHAEVNAINSVEDQSLLEESTAYVTLEPCSHFGKTPPCADLLIAKKIKKVFVSNLDPNPKVAGKGIQKLKDAGIEVHKGLLQDEGAEINKRFFTFHTKQRPYVILKWAQTADGFVARENFDSKWISGSLSRQLVHKWRGEEDAIMVGTNTAKYDNPSLTVRDWQGKNPIRIVIDRNLVLSNELQLFDGSVPTIVLTEKQSESNDAVKYIRLDELNPQNILEAIYAMGVQSVFIEGGAALLESFVDAGCWDEARIFTSKTIFGKGIAAPKVRGEAVSKERVGDDELALIKR
jgi:diaminohydroxyphosphoribosylaminopyrimidine deaminase / 5-amino-6-(5-phosphoribosylamino)uracil reductase